MQYASAYYLLQTTGVGEAVVFSSWFQASYKHLAGHCQNKMLD